MMTSGAHSLATTLYELNENLKKSLRSCWFKFIDYSQNSHIT